MLPQSFFSCRDHDKLCIACRIFGMQSNKAIFRGKINISDAEVKHSIEYGKMFIKQLMGPNPRHKSFYLDEEEKHIAGRKFFFHHYPQENALNENPRMINGRSNGPIYPLDAETQFHFRIDFTNLERDEFALLLWAIVLNEDMRHKIGYGKPIGMGSIQLYPTSLTLIDYATRYTSQSSNGGKQVLNETNELWDAIYNYTNTYQIPTKIMDELGAIWRWPADKKVTYAYPSNDWFKGQGRGKRISETSYL
jgi:CRISPR-associated protein (TIGR03986 family)